MSVHAPGFPPSHDTALIAEAVGRLGIEHAVLLDPEFEYWQAFDNPGWPARYLFGAELQLVDVHFGEGGYEQTERAIQRLLEIDEPLTELLDQPDRLIVPSSDQPGAYSGPYAAGQVWVVTEGAGTLSVNGLRQQIEAAGAHLLIDNPLHSEGVLQIEADESLTVHATCFVAGIAPGAA